MTRIFIDADACPVREEALRVAMRHQVEMLVVSNGGIRPSPHPLVRTVIVPDGPDAADLWIAERAGPGDVCVTADLPLAARVIEAGARAIRHDGETFTPANIGERLAMRDLMQDLRAANPLGHHGGARPFAKADRSRFLDGLERAVRAARTEAPRPAACETTTELATGAGAEPTTEPATEAGTEPATGAEMAAKPKPKTGAEGAGC